MSKSYRRHKALSAATAAIAKRQVPSGSHEPGDERDGKPFARQVPQPPVTMTRIDDDEHTVLHKEGQELPSRFGETR